MESQFVSSGVTLTVPWQVPIGHLFGPRPHQPHELAALVAHFLRVVRDGVASAHATRTCAVCLEQLFCAYGAMLFVAAPPLSAATPAAVARDLAVFGALLGEHCSSGPFASRDKAASRVRAAAVLSQLNALHGLLLTALCPASGAAVEADKVVECAAGLRTAKPALCRELLCRLLDKCRVPKLRGAWRIGAALDTHEAAAAKQLQACAGKSLGTVVGGGAGGSFSSHKPEPEAGNAADHFFCFALAAVRLGKHFTAERLLELVCPATRRWARLPHMHL